MYVQKPWHYNIICRLLPGHLAPITKTIQVRRTRYAGNYWRSNYEAIGDILLRTASHGRAKKGWPARIYIQQLSADTESSLEDFPGGMDDRDDMWEMVREIHADSRAWWSWWYSVLMLNWIVWNRIICIKWI